MIVFNKRSAAGFSLVEVVLAIGIVAFAVLSTFGLLSVATDTSRRSREEGNAARLTANEFDRLRSLGLPNFPTANYSRYYDSDLKEVTSGSNQRIYELHITLATAPAGTADDVFNAEVHFPAQAVPANQNVYAFTTLLNIPAP